MNNKLGQSLRTLVLASRPKTLLASASPVILGVALARQNSKFLNPSSNFPLKTCFEILVTALLIQILCNFVNDLWDFYKGSDTKNRLGPLRVVSSGMLSPERMKSYITILTIIIILLGLDLSLKGGIPILTIGIMSIIGAYAYTAGPYPLAYNGLGEIFVFIFFGPVSVFGTYYLVTQEYNILPVVYGICPGLLAAAILLINNIRDYDEDKANNKNTIAVKFGKRLSSILFTLFLTIPFFIVVALSLKNNLIINFTLLLIPLSYSLIRMMLKCRSGSDYNSLLAKVGMYLFVFCLSLSILTMLYSAPTI